MPTLTQAPPSYEQRPIWEVAVNTLGAVVEALWPGNWIGAPMVQETMDQSPAGNFWKGLYAAQQSMTLTPDDTASSDDPVDLLPVIVGTVVATFFVLRK